MLPFFRRIRKSLLESGRLSKYLLYAMGEILLVVIGILIALQVNNWNMERASQTEEQRIVADLQDEIAKAMLSRTEILHGYRANQATLGSALDKLFSGRIIPLTVDECQGVSFSHGIRWDPRSISTLEELVATGKLALLRDAHLRERLITFRNVAASNTRRLDQIFLELNVLVDAFPLLIQRNWKAELQDSEFICNTRKMQSDRSFLARLQSNHGRLRAPINAAAVELEHLEEISQILSRYE
ncbi:MAG: DUF6090 family protein [Saprospiraceae bacterium]|nr:DUF6090 family protein [Saprospiraceae bacterium]